MRKFLFFLCYSVALILLVSACESVDNDSTKLVDSAMGLGEEFIEKLYTVDDPNFDNKNIESLIAAQKEFSPYLTEEEFENLANNRFLVMPQEVANKQDTTISVQNLELEKYERDHVESDSLDFDHSFTLLFTDQDGEVIEVELSGQMTIVDTEDGLKIDRYYDSKIPINMLSP